jgi:chromosome segregation ATPase
LLAQGLGVAVKTAWIRRGRPASILRLPAAPMALLSEAVQGEARVAYDLSTDFRRPLPLALAAVALIGWLLVAYFASQVSDVQGQMHDALARAEKARETMAADLQNLQKTSGDLADVQKQLDSAKTAFAESNAARSAAQNDLASLTKQIAEARLAASGAGDEAKARANDLQAVQDKLKDANDQLASVQPQVENATAERDKVLKAVDEAKAALGALQKQSDALAQQIAEAKSQLADLQQQGDAANRALTEAQAKLQATQKQIEDQQPKQQ